MLCPPTNTSLQGAATAKASPNFFCSGTPSHHIQHLACQLSPLLVHIMDPFNWCLLLVLSPSILLFNTLFIMPSSLILITCPNHLRAPSFIHSATPEPLPLPLHQYHNTYQTFFLHPILMHRMYLLSRSFPPCVLASAVVHSTSTSLRHKTELGRLCYFLYLLPSS